MFRHDKVNRLVLDGEFSSRAILLLNIEVIGRIEALIPQTANLVDVFSASFTGRGNASDRIHQRFIVELFVLSVRQIHRVNDGLFNLCPGVSSVVRSSVGISNAAMLAFCLARWISKIFWRSATLGRSMKNARSQRPARINSGGSD